MKDEALTDALLRQFVLGNVNDEERQRIESLFLTDSVTHERVLAAEQELIEDYLEDSLPLADKQRFLRRYARTPEQQRKLRITGSIRDWAAAEAAAGVRETSAATETRVTKTVDSSSLWSRLVGGLKARPVFVVPIAAVIILAVVFSMIWLNRRAEQQRQLAIEQEITRLNDPSHRRSVPVQVDALVLTPVTLRSGNPPPELKLRADVPVVELLLRSIQKERYPTYQAVLRRVDDDKSITIPNLTAEEDGRTFRLRLPLHLLTRGIYQIELTATGSAGSPEVYQFTVSD